ncbi:Syntaxin-6 [Trichoplax sp. H2]|nr:Syntaxin-6 [Trichoplax sp. H2]|eukprot:RDD44456.1 Syntaxin-6 [Trichoplax sp. H2]
MSIEDPFFVVKTEVQKNLNNTTVLHKKWRELSEDGRNTSKEDFTWTTNELKNNIRSMEWDLEDLEETINIPYFYTFHNQMTIDFKIVYIYTYTIILNLTVPIVESNPSKFRIDDLEINERKSFISRTKKTIKEIKEELTSTSRRAKKEKHEREALLGSKGRHQDRYTRLDKEIEQSNQNFIEENQKQQQQLFRQQDDQIEMISKSVGVLKQMGQHIDGELTEQAALLEDFDQEMTDTKSRLDRSLIKIEKVLKLSGGKNMMKHYINF